jgi:hypothetical protein
MWLWALQPTRNYVVP